MKIKWISWTNGVLGLLLLITPFTVGYSFGYSVIVGILIAALSFWEAWNVESRSGSTIVSVLGIWLIFAPSLMGYSAIRLIFWSNLIVGLTVALLANFQTTKTPRRLVLHGRH